MVLNMVHSSAALGNPPKTRRERFLDALLDASIVGGISAISTGFLASPDVAPGVALASFLMAFLVKLRDLREPEK